MPIILVKDDDRISEARCGKCLRRQASRLARWVPESARWPQSSGRQRTVSCATLPCPIWAARRRFVGYDERRII